MDGYDEVAASFEGYHDFKNSILLIVPECVHITSDQ